MAMLASKDFIAAYKKLLVAGLNLIIGQESNAYPSELAWHVVVSLRLFHP